MLINAIAIPFAGLAVIGCAGPSVPTASPVSVMTVTAAPSTVTAAPAVVTVTAEPTTVAPSTAQPAPVAQSGRSSSTAAAAVAVMPDVMCQNLQDAQDEIQRAGVFISRSHDATGQGPVQVMDRNWLVVAQTPAVGSPVGEALAILSVVKIGERNSR